MSEVVTDLAKINLGPPNGRSTYCREEGIVFNRKPDTDWQYMATATGRTGVSVMAAGPLVLQVNHEASLNERGFLCVIARVHIEMDGHPMEVADHYGRFRMVHDLQRSCIRILADEVSVTIFAHMTEDVVCMEIEDNRVDRKKMSVHVTIPYVARQVTRDDYLAWWHENGETTAWHSINLASGLEDDSAFEDPLKNRNFGLAIQVEGSVPAGNGWIIPAGQKHRIFIKAAAGKEVTGDSLIGQLQKKPPMDELRATHDHWFMEFWNHTYFECSHPRMAAFVASYDFYRYFTAVVSGKDAEFPARFQLCLLSNTLKMDSWKTMQIHSIETIQAYYGIVRNGDWEAWDPLFRDYRDKIPIYQAYTRKFCSGGGFFIPYETNIWGTAHYCIQPRGRLPDPSIDEYHLYHLENHKYSMYSFEHGLALLCFLWDGSRARGKEEDFTAWGLEALYEHLIFFMDQYRQPDGKLVFFPATAGETWYAAKNPSSWIALMQVRLPQIASLGAKFNHEKLSRLASLMLELLPPLPLGQWGISPEGVGWLAKVDSAEEVLLPAEEFTPHESINRQNTELLALWPYGLMGIGLPKYDLALRTYHQRRWKRAEVGWAQDCIWAACLGLTDEAMSFTEWQFQDIFRCPGGFAYEEAARNPEAPTLPLVPSMQGMGTSVCVLYEMICQDRNGELLLLAAWPRDVPFSICMYTASGGRTKITYTTQAPPVCMTEFPVSVHVS